MSTVVYRPYCVSDRIAEIQLSLSSIVEERVEYFYYNYDAKSFNVLHKCNNAHQLKVMEAIFIILLEPELCKMHLSIN